MSRAKEWADRRREAERDQPIYVNAQKGMVARVNSLGYLEFTAPLVEDAVDFARWILDTYEDRP